MGAETPFGDEPSDSREAIMHATFCALQEHGYAGLSIQRIADESELSKSTFYHHFDGKDDLLLSFMDFMVSEFTRIYSVESDSDPVSDLRTYLDMSIGKLPDSEIERSMGEFPDDGAPDRQQLVATYVELRAQAVRDAAYREKVTEMEAEFREQLTTIIAEGIDEGVFREVDPEASAEMLGTILDGAAFREATRTDTLGEGIREQLDDYLQHHLLADGT